MWNPPIPKTPILEFPDLKQHLDGLRKLNRQTRGRRDWRPAQYSIISMSYRAPLSPGDSEYIQASQRNSGIAVYVWTIG